MNRILIIVASTMFITAFVTTALYADLVGSLRMELESTYQADGVGSTRDRVRTSFAGDYRSGSYQGAIDTFYRASRTLASGASEVLCLVGSLTNSIGETVIFSTVKGIAFQNTGATSTLTITSGLWSGAVTSAIVLPPYGAVSLVCSATVGIDTDRITVANDGTGTGTYRVWIVGLE